jgi:hypothetical protein
MRGAKSNALSLRRANWNRICLCVALVIRAIAIASLSTPAPGSAPNCTGRHESHGKEVLLADQVGNLYSLVAMFCDKSGTAPISAALFPSSAART